MKLQYSTFIMPHIGDSYSQCADRFAISKEKHCFAIADGVGASFFPEVWAEMVSNDFIDHCESFEENTILVRELNLITRWNEVVKEKISNLTDEEKFLVEMSKERCDFGACTFVGLSIDNMKWYCKALGDSYLFVLDKDFNIINSVASQKGHDFDNFPEYFASVHGKNNGTIVSESGNMSDVEYLVLLTDAISDWFIKASLYKRQKLISVFDMQMFNSLITEERTCGDMKDDDTTAVIIKVVNDDTEYISVEELYNTDIDQLIREEYFAKQEKERLEKEAQTSPQPIEEPQNKNDTPTIVETPPEINADTNDKEALLFGKLLEFLHSIPDSIKSFVNDIDSSSNSKKWKDVKYSLKHLCKESNKVSNKLNKMQQ